MVKQLLLIRCLIACGMTARAQAPSRAYIYDSADDSRAIVLNLTNGMLTFQDKKFVRVDEITEFRGSIQICDDGKYFCLTGAIDLVIPKVLSSTKWNYHGVTCSASLRKRSSTFTKLFVMDQGAIAAQRSSTPTLVEW